MNEPVEYGRGWRHKAFILTAGALITFYAIYVLWYSLLSPYIGFQYTFSTVVGRVDTEYLRVVARGSEPPAPPTSASGDTPSIEFLPPLEEYKIVQLGDYQIRVWPQLPRALLKTQARLARGERTDPPTAVQLGDEEFVLVKLKHASEPEPVWVWCRLDSPPIDFLFPSVLWLFLKLGLFAVGALVYWNRPTDRSAAYFFLLSIVTVGAYMGGYHCSRIATRPELLLIFMICAVLLPAVSLHFYLIFPRPKEFLLRHPRWTLLALYGLPLAFLAALAVGYVDVRLAMHQLFEKGLVGEQFEQALDRLRQSLALMRDGVSIYIGMAGVWYLASVVCLVHSYRRAADVTERNQVKWIMFGALLALVPIGHTLYVMMVREGGDFGSESVPWTMFAASACFTAAFTISITRYRLMQLDQIISSGMVYFLISFLAGLVYCGIVFVGTLIFSRWVQGPSLDQAIWISFTALVLMVALDLARSRLKRALDRRFSKEKYQLDHTLKAMGDAIEQLVDPPTLARRLLQASAGLLGVSRGAVYLREGEPPLYRLAGSLGPTPPLTELAPGCPLVDTLQARGALIVRSAAWASADPAQGQLRFLGGEVAQALAHEGRLLALLILGPKSPGPYGPDDLNLLATFAQLTALALESADGHRTIETLNRDLQTKVEKISEQQRRIIALQGQLMRQKPQIREVNGEPANGAVEITPESRSGELSINGILGGSPPVRELLRLVRKVSGSQSAVLIRGESGTGKELLARALHDHSPRGGKTFVKVHCAALSPGLLESELFGHVKGAFTGAHRDKVGRFELANGGTLFLDEIGDISLEVQTKLLRVLQEMTFERVGSSDPVQVDVRIIAATHQDLEELIRQGRFREDLYYRLNVISIPVPPLRQRTEDIVELATHFLRLYAQRCNKAVNQIDDDALLLLKAYSWPGNVRQLENVIERAVVVVEGPLVTVQDLPPELQNGSDNGTAGEAVLKPRPPGLTPVNGARAEREEWNRRERERLVRALAAADGNKAEAARALGLARSTLLSRLKKHGLQ